MDPQIGAPGEGEAPRRRRHAARRGLGGTDETALGALDGARTARGRARDRVRGTDRPASRTTPSPSTATACRRRAAAASSSSGRTSPSEFGPDGFVDYWTTSEPDGAAGPRSATSISRPTSPGMAASSRARSRCSDEQRRSWSRRPRSARPSSRPVTPSPFTDEFRDGNRQVTGQRGHPADGPERHAERGRLDVLARWRASPTKSTVTVFETNPNAIVRHFSDRSVGCELSNAAGDTGILFVEPERGRGLHRCLRHLRRRHAPRSRDSAAAS